MARNTRERLQYIIDAAGVAQEIARGQIVSIEAIELRIANIGGAELMAAAADAAHQGARRTARQMATVQHLAEEALAALNS